MMLSCPPFFHPSHLLRCDALRYDAVLATEPARPHARFAAFAAFAAIVIGAASLLLSHLTKRKQVVRYAHCTLLFGAHIQYSWGSEAP